jgi:ABC-type Na+ efflux pump permease subunit
MKSTLTRFSTSSAAAGLALLVPVLAHAQTIQAILTKVSDIMGLLIPMALSAALIAFFYGLAKLLWGGAGGKEEAQTLIMMGVGALFVMVSIWGIVALLQRTLGISSVTRVPAPSICGQGGCGTFAPGLQ